MYNIFAFNPTNLRNQINEGLSKTLIIFEANQGSLLLDSILSFYLRALGLKLSWGGGNRERAQLVRYLRGMSPTWVLSQQQYGLLSPIRSNP